MNQTEELVKKLKYKNKTIATMESCTGGGLASSITNIQGASKVLKYSAVTYSDEYKIKMGVKKDTIDTFGVYSKETACDMAKAISDFTHSDYGVGITGVINKMAYICIYEKNKNKLYSYEIKLEDKERIKNKEEIIALVVCKLNEILSFEN